MVEYNYQTRHKYRLSGLGTLNPIDNDYYGDLLLGCMVISYSKNRGYYQHLKDPRLYDVDPEQKSCTIYMTSKDIEALEADVKKNEEGGVILFKGFDGGDRLYDSSYMHVRVKEIKK